MYSLLIKNAKVIDGSGKPGEILDVAISGDEIANIDKNITSNAQTVIDGSGKILSPGFIDIQNHSDAYWQLFENPGLDSLTTQGFTTILVGQCGASLAPLLSRDALLSIQKWHSLEGINVNWQSFSEFVEELSKSRFACNVASLVGYSTLRRGIVGDNTRRLEKNEINALKKVLQDSLDSGAFGLSSGLSYAHEVIISELELYELAKIIAKKKALFSIHLRSETSEIYESVEEALDIARNTDVNLKISHLKIRGRQNWGKAQEVVNALESSYHKGVNVHFDIYPYDTTWLVLYSYLPKWAVEGGRMYMLKHFNDPIQRNKILTHLHNSETKFSELLVASTANKLNFMGKTIGQIAKNMEVSSEEAILHLIQNGGSEVLVFDKNLNTGQVDELVFHPLSFVATDGGGFNKTTPSKLVHPRCFGTAAKFLKMAMNSEHTTLEEAVQKMTAGPAKKIGLQKRGEIKVGNFADLALWQPQTLTDKATYENPYQYSLGMDYVFVNGKAVVAKGKLTDQLPGYVLRKK